MAFANLRYINVLDNNNNNKAHHIFQPVAVESLGPINASGRVFLSKFGRKLADQSGDNREISFIFQRLSVLIQQYNAIFLFCEGGGGVRFIPA